MRLLNLGCGTRVHPEWVNVDFVSQKKNVISHNLEKGIPFGENSFDVVYHSHLLEHFTKPKAEFLMRECHRVLNSGGIIRVATPDLEMLTNAYLDALDKVTKQNGEWDSNYEWTVLHFLDQAVRTEPGGEMRKYLLQDKIVNANFVYNMMGSEALTIRNSYHKTHSEKLKTSITNEGALHTIKIIIRNLFHKNLSKELLLKFILGGEYETLKIGRFRQSGENHQWIYDRYSLSKLMKKCGFKNVLKTSAHQSLIPNWSKYYLDTELDGKSYRPDSLFMEGLRH